LAWVSQPFLVDDQEHLVGGVHAVEGGAHAGNEGLDHVTLGNLLEHLHVYVLERFHNAFSVASQLSRSNSTPAVA
jgi:hypothetical protein